MSINSSATIKVRVAKKIIEAEDIASFDLIALDGQTLPEFDAGAHIDVHLPDGLVRQYSLCNSPSETGRYQIAVLRDPATRGGSAAMHDEVRAGDVITISAPKNHFPLDQWAAHTLLVAGGIGVTPILAMAERLSAINASFEMHYCTRNASRTAFNRRLAASAFSERVRIYHDDAPDEKKFDLARCLRHQPGAHLYVCGPGGFLDAVRKTARTQGWDDGQIHYEYFSNTLVAKADEHEFEIVLQRSGKVIPVKATQTIIEVLSAHGVVVPVSCQQGVCGTCLTNVLEGEIDHRDLYLSPEEQAANTCFLPCCSRAKSQRLVLDL